MDDDEFANWWADTPNFPGGSPVAEAWLRWLASQGYDPKLPLRAVPKDRREDFMAAFALIANNPER